MHAPHSRVLADVSGQVVKARVVSRIDCGDSGSGGRGGDAYVVRLSSGQRITVQGSTLTTNSKGE